MMHIDNLPPLVFELEELTDKIINYRKDTCVLSNFIEMFHRSHMADECEVVLAYEQLPRIELIQTYKPDSYPLRAKRIQKMLEEFNTKENCGILRLHNQSIFFDGIFEEREFNSNVYIKFYGEFKTTNLKYLIVVRENKITLQFYLNKGKNNDNN